MQQNLSPIILFIMFELQRVQVPVTGQQVSMFIRHESEWGKY
jgi:hypothetical protein